MLYELHACLMCVLFILMYFHHVLSLLFVPLSTGVLEAAANAIFRLAWHLQNLKGAEQSNRELSKKCTRESRGFLFWRPFSTSNQANNTPT